MDKPFDKDNMETFFRQAFADLDKTPSDDGWDSPSDAVWAGVQGAIGKERPSRKGVLWLWFGAPGLALLAGIFFVFWHKGQELKEKIGEQALANERLQSAVDSLGMLLARHSLQAAPAQEPAGAGGQQFLPAGVFSGEGRHALPGSRIGMLPPALDSLFIPPLITGIQEGQPDAEKSPSGPGFSRLDPLPAAPAEGVYPGGGAPVAFPLVQQAGRKPRLYLGAYSSWNYTSRDLFGKASGPGLPARPIFEMQEQGRASPEFGLKAGLQLSRRFALESGLGMFGIRQQSRQLFRVVYDPGREQPAGSGTFESTYALAVPSAYGESQIEVDIRRDAGQRLLPGETIGLEVWSRQDIRFVSVPLLARFDLISGRFSLGAKGGAALNFLQASSLQTTVQVRRNGLQAPGARVRHRFSEVRDANIDYQLGISARYLLAPGLEAALEPTYRQNLRPLTEAWGFNTRAYAFGLHLGLNYRF